MYFRLNVVWMTFESNVSLWYITKLCLGSSVIGQWMALLAQPVKSP